MYISPSDTGSSLQPPPTPELALDDQGRARLPWKKEGYSYWNWKDTEHQNHHEWHLHLRGVASQSEGHQIHYVAVESESGRSQSKAPVVLIHGFGASVFHWRYNIPEIAKEHPVFAIDLIGFGLSDKPLTDYNAEIWREQLAAFLQEVVGVGGSLGGPKAIVVGNSLGGYTALATAAYHPELVQACAVLNGAGSFDPEIPPDALKEMTTTQLQTPKKEKDFLDTLKDKAGQAVRRILMYSAFYYTKQPGRIKQVLQQVYVNKENVDDELVESIRYPSLHPNAAEVFYRVVTRTSTAGALATVNKLLGMLESPLLLLWGQQDPWINKRAAERMATLYPSAKYVGLDAGHCPHDESPTEVNAALLEWIEELSSSPSP